MHDNLGRIVAKAVPDRSGNWCGLGASPACNVLTHDVYYGYDLLGNMTYARFASPSGEGITNVFNARGQLTSTTNDMDSVSRTLSYLYDAAGNRTRITYPDDSPTNPRYVNYNRHPSGQFYYASLNGTSSWLFYPTRDTAGRVDLLRRAAPTSRPGSTSTAWSRGRTSLTTPTAT